MAGDAVTETPSAPVDDIVVTGTVIPGETAEPATPAEALETVESSSDAEPDPASDAGKQLAKKRKSLHARIDELTTEKYSARAETDAAKAEIAALRRELDGLKRGSAPAEPAKVADSGKPKLQAYIDQIGAKFQTWEEANEAYQDDRDAWRDAEGAKKRAADEAQRSERDVLTKAQERIEAFKAEHPDYDDVVNKAMIPADAIGGRALIFHLNHSEVGAQLAYELGKDPAELARVVSLRPEFVGEALGELKAMIKARSGADRLNGPTPKTPVAKPASPPFKPLGGSPVTSDDEGDPDDLSEAAVTAHIRRENAKDLKRRRG